MPQTPKPAPKLRDQLHAIIRTKHYSLRTEKTYWYWIRYFIRFHRLRHPRDMAEAEVAQFLTWLATHKNVAAATQNQALNALEPPRDCRRPNILREYDNENTKLYP